MDEEESERKAAKEAQERISKTDRIMSLYNESIKDDEEQLKKLPAMIYMKKQEVHKVSKKLSEVKAIISGREKDEKYRIRGNNPKFTVEQAEHEARKILRRDGGYKNLKSDESSLHEQIKHLKDERDYLTDTKECIEIRRRKV
ncbi:hypothetical protein KAR91_44375 [Candidatus Pacearchaeota archaeon]|nr:hypothetical protein [Candidatus Pacearchaeota archaeon]